VQLQKLLRINEGDNQLYVGMIMAKLRSYQRAGGVPDFEAFCTEVEEACVSPGQSGLLAQRLELLREFVAEIAVNEELSAEQRDLEQLVESGVLVVADLTDPILAPPGANGLFQVLLEQFRQSKMECSKLLVCDEAHKYFGDHKTMGLAGAIGHCAIHAARGYPRGRVDPIAAQHAARVARLSTVAVCHSFHSQDWYRYLSTKLPLPAQGFDGIRELNLGEALVFSSRSQYGDEEAASRRSRSDPASPRTVARRSVT